MLPQVAIVGRPNVGKSSILNWIAGRLVSVVDPTAGVTRDRVTWLAEHEDPDAPASHPGDPAPTRFFELVDTGGMGIVDRDDLTGDVDRQIELALQQADVVVFVVDSTTGVVPLDQLVADRLRGIDKPVLMVVNKADSPKLDIEAAGFLTLGDFDQVITSVKGARGRRELLDEIVRRLPPPRQDDPDAAADPVLRLACVGRRNVGKSTFLNALAGFERMIVSEVAGTTRDSVDVRLERDGQVLVVIDTPGVRRKKSLADDVEFYGLVRAQKSVRRADVVLMFFDATETISKVDRQLVQFIDENHKPVVFVVNKWDLGLSEGMTSERWAEYLAITFATLRHVPVAFLTARETEEQKARNVEKVIALARSVYRGSLVRVSTGKLNRAVEAAYKANPPRYLANRRGKILYATQVATAPPTIVLKVNDPKLFDNSWRRYLISQLRQTLPLEETPLKVYYRGREREE